MTEDRVIATYSVQIYAPLENTYEAVGQEKRVLADLPVKIEEMEENLTDLLPEGWRVVVSEWDGEDRV